MVNLQTERYSPCHLLSRHGVPCYIWAEDALHHYGVKTILFTLQIIVQDNKAAAEILMENGWKLETDAVRPATIDDATAKFLTKYNTADDANQLIALLNSSEWNIALPSYASEDSIIPSLPDIVDTLIDRWLDIPDENLQFRMMLAVYLCYLYEYNERLQSLNFTQELKMEHRQYHLDALAGVSKGSMAFKKHQLKIRELLRKGEFELCECSVDRKDTTFFIAQATARLRTTMRIKEGKNT